MKLTQEENMTLDMMIDCLNDSLNDILSQDPDNDLAALKQREYSLMRKLRTIAAAHASPPSLLRPAGERPTVCYCPPDKCMAPDIHGQRVACMRSGTRVVSASK